jgi:hypothetical protein
VLFSSADSDLLVIVFNLKLLKFGFFSWISLAINLSRLSTKSPSSEARITTRVTLTFSLGHAATCAVRRIKRTSVRTWKHRVSQRMLVFLKRILGLIFP